MSKFNCVFLGNPTNKPVSGTAWSHILSTSGDALIRGQSETDPMTAPVGRSVQRMG